MPGQLALVTSGVRLAMFGFIRDVSGTASALASSTSATALAGRHAEAPSLLGCTGYDVGHLSACILLVAPGVLRVAHGVFRLKAAASDCFSIKEDPDAALAGRHGEAPSSRASSHW